MLPSETPRALKSFEVQGINSADTFLKAGATRKRCAELAANTGISEQLILPWANKTDLFRKTGVAGQCS